MIAKNRDSRGGGVAIVFDQNKITLKPAFAFPKSMEVVCGVGRVIQTNRRIVVCSMYIPPKTDATTLLCFKSAMEERLERMKADLGEFDLYLGGDLNKRDVSDCFRNFPRIQKLDQGPTRGAATLDVCYSNMQEKITSATTCAPLEDEMGRKSDHMTCTNK